MRALCPWIEGADLPLLRRWCELERHSSFVHAALSKFGIINGEGEARRLLDEHRKLALAQSAIGAELGLSPSARMQIKASGTRAPFDLALAMVRDAKNEEAANDDNPE